MGRLSAGRVAVIGVALFAAAMTLVVLDLLHVAELSLPAGLLYAAALWFIGGALYRRYRQSGRQPWM